MSEKKKDAELECPICLDKIAVSDHSYTTTTPCNHFYHSDCILLWTKLSASTCPQCRTELSSVKIINESKVIPIEHKKADTLIGMIEQSSSSTNPVSNHANASSSASSYAHNHPRIITTEGLVNVLVSTPENATRRQNRSLYERMIEATSNPIFHPDDNDADFDDYNEDESYSRTSSNARRSGSLFRRRERSIYTVNEPDTGHNKLSNQQCCICDTSVSVSQVIVCPQCSALYHLSCCDGLNCPLCEEWIDDVQTPSITCVSKRSRNTASRAVDRTSRLRDSSKAKNDDSGYYVELVNELQRRSSNNPSEATPNTLPRSSSAGNPQSVGAESTTEREAWQALNMIQQSSNNEEPSDDKEVQIPLPTDTVPDYPPLERKLKRPKRSISKPLHTQPAKLTELALAHLDSKNDNSKRSSNKSYHSISRQKSIVSSTHEGLSFTQKLIVQRLLLKPRLNKDLANKLTFDSYTELNKHLSHKLYSYVQKNQLAISSMNAVIELAEREGFLPFVNRKSVDQFNSSCKSNPIITRFVNCDWRNDDKSFTGQVQNIINVEVQKWINL